MAHDGDIAGKCPREITGNQHGAEMAAAEREATSRTAGGPQVALV